VKQVSVEQGTEWTEEGGRVEQVEAVVVDWSMD